MKEVWKDVPNYEGEYQVSNIGAVRSLDRRVRNSKKGSTRLISGVILKPHLENRGYLTVSLGRWNPKGIHRLVLSAFVEPCPKGMECRHLNGTRTDNRLENLCWGTRKENQTDRIKHGTTSRGERNGMSKLTGAEVLEIRKKRESGISAMVLAEQYGVSAGHIRKIISKIVWIHQEAFSG